MVKIKTTPQFKITCKRISPKVNIESVDKRFVDEYKDLLDKYELTVKQLAKYPGAVDEEGAAKDTHDYEVWKNNHPDIISKKSINNLFRKIKNKSRLDYKFGDGDDIAGTIFNAGFIEGRDFSIQIVHPIVYPRGIIIGCIIGYHNNVVSIENVNVDIGG